MWERPKRIEPGPGQESVWDYPRPPALEPVRKRIRVEFAGQVIADTTAAYRVCETSHAPAYYLPLRDVDDVLVGVEGASYCEWKGVASYYDVVVGDRTASRAAWTYHDPTKRFEPIREHVAFYAAPMDRCWVGDNEVSPMDGDFYGGWITPDLVGPFKGAPGTRHW
jgi:uncharacterized protein (DUF427 family)